MRPDKFLTADQQATVADAVRLAEKGTSGEIRIHIDGECSGDPVRRAAEVFGRLGMHRTDLRNGVLIYMACNSKVFAVIGDKGINDRVPHDFWDDILETLRTYFRLGNYTEGLSEAVLKIGVKLKEYFPYQDGDINEQPDEISFGKQEE